MTTPSRPPEAPLTAEEEADLREDFAIHGANVYGDDVARLLATLDRDRAARGGEGLRDLVIALDAEAASEAPDWPGIAKLALAALRLAASPTTEPGDGGLDEPPTGWGEGRE